MAMKRTCGGPKAPHIKTLTLGKNIVIIQRATRNGPPDTKVVDVHLHGCSHNSLFISIRSRGCHPLTRLQRQKVPKAPSYSLFAGFNQVLEFKSRSATTKINWSPKLSSGLLSKCKHITSRRESGTTLLEEAGSSVDKDKCPFIFHP